MLVSPPATVHRPPPTLDYAELKRRVTEAGLLRPARAYAIAMLVANTAVFAGLFAMLHVFSGFWMRCLIALLIGFWSGQIGFQLHDAGHRQLFRYGRLDRWIAYLSADVLLGMSSSWWIDKHNRHHGNPNHVDLDPDIKVGMVSYSEEHAEAKTGFGRWVAARQAHLFFVLILGLGWAMHYEGARFLSRSRSRHRPLQGAVLVAHAAAYIALLVVLVGPGMALLVVVIQKSVAGAYMAVVFAPNHKGMPQVHAGTELDFLRLQVLTARNVRSHRLTDFLYGGLNYQIEHHLFPTMPRRNVRAAQPIIRAFCHEAGIPYYETSILQSYREILSYLHEVGAPLRASLEAGPAR